MQVLQSLITGFPQGLENLENESGHGKVAEHEKWQKVMEFYDQSWNLTNFAPEFYQISFLTFKDSTSA